MTRTRDHFGPPYSDAELQEEAALATDLVVTPEMQELADYLAGALDDSQRAAVDQRLSADPAYRAWAAPLLALPTYRPRSVLQVRPEDVARLDRAITRRITAVGPAPTTPPTSGPRPRWRLLFLLASAIAFAAFGIWATRTLRSRANEALLAANQPIDPRTLIELRPGPGARFVLAESLDADSLARVVADGPGLLLVRTPQTPPSLGALSAARVRVETPTHLFDVAYGVLRFERASDSTITVTLLAPGSATMRRRDQPPAAARAMSVSTTEVIWRALKPGKP